MRLRGRALDALTAAKLEAVNVLASPLLNLWRSQIIDRMRDVRLPRFISGPSPPRTADCSPMDREICSVAGMSSASWTRFCVAQNRLICPSNNHPSSSWP
jgi:hypothetical protein